SRQFQNLESLSATLRLSIAGMLIGIHLIQLVDAGSNPVIPFGGCSSVGRARVKHERLIDPCPAPNIVL
ncbi:MAG: hypothetical protein ACXABY_18080, partial [Candidatus Thorarchaeota archaeon]